MNNIHDLVDALIITLGMLIDLHRQSFTRDEVNAILRYADKLKAEAIRQSSTKETPTAANLEHAAKLLALSVPDALIEPLRAEWGNTNLAVLKHWRDEVLTSLSRPRLPIWELAKFMTISEPGDAPVRHKFRDLREQMAPESQARAEVRTTEMLKEIDAPVRRSLDDLIAEWRAHATDRRSQLSDQFKAALNICANELESALASLKCDEKVVAATAPANRVTCPRCWNRWGAHGPVPKCCTCGCELSAPLSVPATAPQEKP